MKRKKKEQDNNKDTGVKDVKDKNVDLEEQEVKSHDIKLDKRKSSNIEQLVIPLEVSSDTNSE